LLTAGGSAPHETLSLPEALGVGAITMAVVAGLGRPGARPGLPAPRTRRPGGSGYAAAGGLPA
ncbi:hypothetical protein PV437_37075, partial [Streptomyces scabiei]|nr:hypothetical protein [Streptomyces scabiei]